MKLEKVITAFYEKGYHLFKSRYNGSWGYYAISFDDMEEDESFQMMDAKYVSGSVGGCKDSIIINQ